MPAASIGSLLKSFLQAVMVNVMAKEGEYNFSCSAEVFQIRFHFNVLNQFYEQNWLMAINAFFL